MERAEKLLGMPALGGAFRPWGSWITTTVRRFPQRRCIVRRRFSDGQICARVVYGTKGMEGKIYEPKDLADETASIHQRAEVTAIWGYVAASQTRSVMIFMSFEYRYAAANEDVSSTPTQKWGKRLRATVFSSQNVLAQHFVVFFDRRRNGTRGAQAKVRSKLVEGRVPLSTRP